MKNLGRICVVALLVLVGALLAVPGAVRGDEAASPTAAVSPAAAPPAAAPPAAASPTAAPPAAASPTAASPTAAPPTAASPTAALPTAAVSPAAASPTAASLAVARIIAETSDLDGNPIANVLITLTPDDGSRPAAQSRTNALGQAAFAGIPLGRYTVSETVPGGQVAITTTTRKVHLAASGQTAAVIFVHDWAFTLTGYTLNDLGQALPGWTIVASSPDTNKVFRTVSDQGGYFRFDQVTAGTWVVTEIVQPGWTAVTSGTITVTVTAGVSPDTIRFTNTTPCAMLDVVVLGDGAPGDGVAGAEITVQPGSGAPLTGKTGSSGRVRFSCLPPGEYSVDETLPTGWLALTRHPLQVMVEASGTPLVVAFRVRPEVARATASVQPPKPSPSGATVPPAAAPTLLPAATPTLPTSVLPTMRPIATPSMPTSALPTMRPIATPGTPPVVTATLPVPVAPTITTPPAPSPAITVSVASTLTPGLRPVVTATVPVLVAPTITTLPAPSPAITVSVASTLTPGTLPVVTTTLPVLVAPTATTALAPSPTITTGMTLPVATATASAACRVKYFIRWGDTLSRLAVRYHTTVKDLMQANNLRSTTIYAGRWLCIP